ncbi:peptidyl-prolyl cis-trans isomerase FKBP42 [Pyrus ussuriensis x Pyrus communis]|uniref:peptidylprolyl isomerase n=1 Tax=Pyrus ussuriensis x Pyrus communis TaxID=2448454 RepID=A0A5N5EUR0_9ROSA|nr:peptidyl-prolyl cis-trans isomerase FKBP42 [Pyrus ussuriensis x Pyrus communis]
MEDVREQAEQESQLLGQDGENETVTEHGTFVLDSKVEILHEKVTNQIIKEGHGQIPSKYSTCFLPYRAWTESTGHKFEDTWDEQRLLEIILGKEKKEMTGLAVGVSSMKSGEHALLHVGWESGHGKEGRFSFPNVPPLADISYEVELIGFDETKESDMTVEERIGAADRRRMNGNALFKDGFSQAIAYMGDNFMFQLFGKYRDMALAVKNPCHLNMAASFIMRKHYEEAIEQCSIACKFAPQDKAIARELRLLAEHDKVVYQKQNEIYKGIFGPTPEPKPKRDNWLIIFWHWLLSSFYRLFRCERHKAE